jgi:hypothetical protein
VKLGDKVTFTYEVTGEVDRVAAVSWSAKSTGGGWLSGGNPPSLQGKASAKWTLNTAKDIDILSREVIFNVSVVGTDKKNYKASCSVPVTGGLELSVVPEVCVGQRGTPFRVLFKCSGAAGPYNAEILVNHTGGKSERIQVKTKDVGEVTVTPLAGDREMTFAVWIRDGKKRKSNGVTLTVPLRDEAPVTLDTEHAFELTDGSYRIRFTGEAPDRPLAADNPELPYGTSQTLLTPAADFSGYAIPVADDDVGFRIGLAGEEEYDTTWFAALCLSQLR